MRILWLNANLLPLEGSRSHWHLMRHLARRTSRTDVRQRRQAGHTARRCVNRAEQSACVAGRGQGALRFYAGVAATSSIRALRWRNAPVGGVSPRSRGCCSSVALRSRGLRFPGPGSEPAADAAVPVDPVHPNVEAGIGANGNAARPRLLYRQQWRRMRFEGRTLARRRLLAVSGPTADVPAALRRRSLRPSMVAAASTRLLHRRPGVRAAGTWRSSARWTGCRRDAVLFFTAKCCRAREAEPDVTLSIVGRARRRR